MAGLPSKERRDVLFAQLGQFRQSWKWDFVFSPDGWTDTADSIKSALAETRFDRWSPVTEVAVDTFVNVDESWPAGMVNLQIPKEVSPRLARLTFWDVDKAEFQRFLERWSEAIFNVRTGRVLRLSKAVLYGALSHEDSTGQRVFDYELLLYPTGTYQPIYDSTSTITSMIVAFTVAGFNRTNETRRDVVAFTAMDLAGLAGPGLFGGPLAA